MVLAAGEGTRLRPLTATLPKPMAPVVHRPLLFRTLGMLRDQGITDIGVNLHHRAESITTTLGDGSSLGVALKYSVEEILLGTAGGVKRLADFFADGPFVVLYGDNLYRFALAPLIRMHHERRALATIATFTAPNPTACGLLLTNPDGLVIRFEEKPPVAFTTQANAGVYVLAPEILQRIPPDTVADFGHDVFPALLARCPDRVFAAPLDGYLQDTGTPAGYFQANWDTLKTGEAGVHTDAIVDPGARLVGLNVVGAGNRIGEGASMNGCILWDDVTVGAGAILQDAILGTGVRVGAGAQIGRGAIVAQGARIAPGATVAKDARIEPGAQII